MATLTPRGRFTRSYSMPNTLHDRLVRFAKARDVSDNFALIYLLRDALNAVEKADEIRAAEHAAAIARAGAA